MQLPLAGAGSSLLHRVASEGQLAGAVAAAAAAAATTPRQGPEEEPAGGWPAAHAFTAVSRVYPYRTVVLHWRDPRLPGMLRPIIQVWPVVSATLTSKCSHALVPTAASSCIGPSLLLPPLRTDPSQPPPLYCCCCCLLLLLLLQGNEQLLKLYESGLPSWAVIFPQYGLWYRPWLRTLTWILFYAFSGG